MKARASRGVRGHSPPGKEHSETLFPAFLETKYPFSRQGWSSLKLSFKSEIFNDNEQMIGDARLLRVEELQIRKIS